MGALGGGGGPPPAKPEGAKSQVASGINLINAEKNMMLIPTAGPPMACPSLAQTNLFSYQPVMPMMPMQGAFPAMQQDKTFGPDKFGGLVPFIEKTLNETMRKTAGLD